MNSDLPLMVNIQVRLDNDASELDILGRFGTSLDILGHFGTIRKIYWRVEHLDCFPSHFRPFSPVNGSFERTRYGPTDRRTDGQTLF